MLSGALPWSLCLLLLPSSWVYHVQAYDATPRWGQAIALLNDSLFIHGGKTDPFNSYSYTAAPNTNDLLYLPLTNPFSTASPPWTLVSNSANSSSLQGPFLAWHTLSPFNPSNVLLFGGNPDPNSATVIVGAADSAGLLSVASPLYPVWTLEPVSWAGEPVRRMRHSTATSASGQVFIIGGEKADGSGNALSDHLVFNPTVPSFTLLPSNGPPDIYGHASIILSDGRLLVFGGYSPSQGTLLPFSTIWVLDTSQSNLVWTIIKTSTTLLPSPRMAFAAVSLDDGGILIHGGSDANLQTNFADGWILDISQNIMNWTQAEALSQLGARRDHFAARQGDQVIFGFGYGNNGPAPAPLQIYNSSSQSLVSLFEPLPPTQTSPTNSQASKSPNPTSRPSSSTSSSTSGSMTTAIPNNPSGSPNVSSSSSRTRTIAVSTTLGALAFIVVLLGTAYYVRRRQQGRDRRFMALGSNERDDGADSLHFEGQIPTAVSTHGDLAQGTHGGNRGLLRSLGLSGAIGVMRNAGNTYQRRDMLADEDTRSFGEWYASRGRDGTGESSWSLRSILGGGPRLLSREASTTSRGTNTGGRNTPWREKSDPFADGTPSLLRDEETGSTRVATPTRPHAHGRREMSHASSKSGLSYRDPFSDPAQEERRQRSDANDPLLEQEEEVAIYDPLRPSVRHVPVLPALITTLPLSQGGHVLSPLFEYNSQHTPTIPESSTATSSHAHSSETVKTPFGGSMSLDTSRTSVDSPPLPSSTIIGTVHNDMRRSDSWWTRFTRATLLDRRSSNASRMSVIGGNFEVRDPKAPPRLDAIAENIHLVSRTPKNSRPFQEERQSPQQQQHGLTLARASTIYGTGHGKSMSSLRTADSEAIEQMAGTMDVFQRIKTRSNSHRTTGSTSSADGMSIDARRRSSLDAGYDKSSQARQEILPDDDLMMFSSPVELLPLSSTLEYPPPRLSSPIRVSQSQMSLTPSSPIRDGSIRPIGSPQPLPYSPISPSSPSVADRIQAFERHMSLEQTSPPPATNTKYREERTKKRVTVDYGLVPRASLFIANPDSHRLSTGSGDP
ncbi:galactose oxidase [Phlegmacium glaucopus]|nr:galactose oxidase [Phlegmacium glaucopus]